ncbi:MFS transporter [Actinocrispum wychmicini]|uniref:Putative MFS family arabinose efflux permease n=1 Tax=Actinocrispum wychmicini TaxID=1213861 RepID=A0A4R2IPW4_9PSEU|nr:MFS transporter [Actinocrispum wychmicini]TCO44785.1 putative MFS family arabinose efflux permease [Actinocrispum wychmicini]
MTTDTESLPRTSLWSANFQLYLGARSTSMLGDAMLPVALSVGVLAAGYGIAGVGYALGAWMGALAACMLIGGVLADRLGPRRLMVFADLVRLVVQAGMAFAFVVGVPSLWLILVLQACSGVATALFQPGVASMVPKVADDVQRANGVLRIAEALAGVLGPALGGVLVSVFGPGTVFGIYAATYGISAGCLMALRIAPAPAERTAQSYRSQLVEGWRDFRSRAWLWGVISIWLVYGSLVPGVALPVVAGIVTGDDGSTGLGIGMAAFGAGGVLGGWVAMRTKPLRPLASGAIGWALFCLYPVVPVLRPGVPLLCVGWLLAGAGLAYWQVIWATTVQTKIPGELLNRVYAYDVCGSLVALTLGRLLAGPLTGLFGASNLMLISTAFGLLCTGALLAAPAIRRLERVN